MDNINESRFSRTSRIFGEDALEKLSKSSVIVFGAGGVGGYVTGGGCNWTRRGLILVL